MRREYILEIWKKGIDYGCKIPAGTAGKDVELGLATTIKDLARYSNIDSKTLIRKLELWVQQLEDSHL